MYGYQIVQALKMAANRQFDFGEGCIYPILHRLEVQEYLQSRRETVAGRSRVVYRITAKGKKQLGDSVTCWQRVVQAVSHVLQGGKHEQPALA
jgi:PadR family transcriptional regulator PadR